MKSFKSENSIDRCYYKEYLKLTSSLNFNELLNIHIRLLCKVLILIKSQNSLVIFTK